MCSREADTRILLTDDHELLREGLSSLLNEMEGFVVVGEAADGIQCLALAEKLKPDILLLDLNLPKLNSMEVLRRLGSSAADLRIILLAEDIEEDQISDAFRFGARGFMLKESACSLLFQCIRSVMAGMYWVGKEPVSDPFKRSGLALDARGSETQPKNFGLTKREMEILAEIVSGRSNREIARQLSISEQTVKHHVTHIFDKIGVYNRLEMALFAIHHGLVRIIPEEPEKR